MGAGGEARGGRSRDNGGPVAPGLAKETQGKGAPSVRRKKLWKRDTKEQAHILKPRLWCERGVENQVMRVSEVLQKRDAKEGIK